MNKWATGIIWGVTGAILAGAVWWGFSAMEQTDILKEEQIARDQILKLWGNEKAKIKTLNEIAMEKTIKENIPAGKTLPPTELAGKKTPYSTHFREYGPTFIRLKVNPGSAQAEILIEVSAVAPGVACAYAHGRIYWNPRIFGSQGETYPADECAEKALKRALYTVEENLKQE